MLPVVLTMISNWFPDAERGRANAIVIMFVPIAGIITAPLSGWIITVLDWRWLFIIEGLLSVVVLVLWAYTVYDRPQEARWISEAEKKLPGRNAGRRAKSHCRNGSQKCLSGRGAFR
ncbi:Permeases of the major facilitator superfamily [Citrobacter freundii]|uniref:Permeases of the major facilitator superfamily n=1 Tax=Citrobacter freundii TaxID=546 RepID=A0A7G2IT65_CITFR|nr:Permeases of the major facilitator superfamily [Citrobacter freundii]